MLNVTFVLWYFLPFSFIVQLTDSLGKQNMDEIQPQTDSPSPAKKSPSKPKRLTLKQKLWVKHYLETKNGRKAAILAGYKAHPGVVGSQNIAKFNKRDDFLAILDSVGLTDKRLFEPIIGALDATLTAISFGEVKKSDSPDHNIRLKASEMGLKLRGLLSKNEEDEASQKNQLIIVIGDKGLDEII